ncbi:hypothetical protein SEA_DANIELLEIGNACE_75 [Arthrobacter phage DanielleIgnace]|nr:hypothetical protein SEA_DANIELLEIGNACE_75 [Arthrobacter phage DanielleIgnace]
MTAWAVISDDNVVLPVTILCSEHVHDPAVLNRHWTQLKINGLFPEEASPNWVQLAPEDNHLANHCVECQRDESFGDSLSQGILPTDVDYPSLTSLLKSEEDPDQGDAEEDPDYVLRKIERAAPVPYGIDLIDKESVEQERVSVTYSEPMVQIHLTVEEVVHYPATVTIPKRRYEETLALFPQVKRNNLPLGLMLRIAQSEDARVVVDERDGDVQGQAPLPGGVREGRTVESE